MRCHLSGGHFQSKLKYGNTSTSGFSVAQVKSPCILNECSGRQVSLISEPKTVVLAHYKSLLTFSSSRELCELSITEIYTKDIGRIHGIPEVQTSEEKRELIRVNVRSVNATTWSRSR